MGIIYVDEEYLKEVAYQLNKKEPERGGLIDKIKNIARKSVRAVTSIQLGPINIDLSRISEAPEAPEAPEILWNTQAAEEYLENEYLKNSFDDVINDVLSEEIHDYDILSITCKKGVSKMVDSYDENGDKRPTFKDASFLYYYQSGPPVAFFGKRCICAKLMSVERDTRLFFRCYFRKIEKINAVFERSPRYSVTIFGIVYDDLGKYLMKQTRNENQVENQVGTKALLVIAASGEIINLPMDLVYAQ